MSASSGKGLRILSQVPLPLLTRVGERFPDAQLTFLPLKGEIEAGVEGDVLLTFTRGSENLAEIIARGVKWVHAFGTGVDDFPMEPLGGVPLTCSRGASSVPIAEWVMAMLLTAEKNLPDSWVSEPPEQWNIVGLGGLQGRTLGLLGLGGIARATAERALAFGMQVIAHRRSDRPSPMEGVELVSFDALLERSDHLVVAAPLTAANRHRFDAKAFARMKPGAHLVNVARGGLVHQEDLRSALDNGTPGLASLDTVDPEPLPAGHWLYTHPRVRLSPHCSWGAPGALDVLLDSFLENLERWSEDRPLLDVVDVEAGY